MNYSTKFEHLAGILNLSSLRKSVVLKSPSRTISPTNSAMPHAISMPAPGFQAVILCGPGVSFDTFTSKPEESPKALIPIANRPMVWYPLDFCYRMGVTSMLLFLSSSLAVAQVSVNNVAFLVFIQNRVCFCTVSLWSSKRGS